MKKFVQVLFAVFVAAVISKNVYTPVLVIRTEVPPSSVASCTGHVFAD